MAISVLAIPVFFLIGCLVGEEIKKQPVRNNLRNEGSGNNH